MRRPLVYIAVLIFTLGLALPAYAAFQVCNKTSLAVRVAFGQFDGTSWASQGWWRIAPMQCATLLTGPLNARYYYLYATDGDGGVWNGTTYFCTAPNNFTISRRGVCATNGYDRRDFFRIDTGQSADWTQSLSN